MTDTMLIKQQKTIIKKHLKKINYEINRMVSK